VKLDKQAARFQAAVGVDDETGGKGTVEFRVYGDGKLLWSSGIMRGGEKAKEANVDIKGIGTLRLEVANGGDDNSYDHADWLNPVIKYEGEKPMTVHPSDNTDRILTPPVGPEPRINGPKVFGVRPGSPFLFTIPATGERPMKFSANPLPEGLKIDSDTGIISGRIADKSHSAYKLMVEASNSKGTAKRDFSIIVGDKIGLTPPLGWNSWNCWGPRVSADKVRASAKAMYDSELVRYGWTYINIDDCWQGERGGEFKAIQPNKRFGDMKQLAYDVHKMGLKLGIYSTPWCMSYAKYIGGSSDDESGSFIKEHRIGKYRFDENDAKQWAAWGIDYLKYDWKPNDVFSTEKMANALKASGRDIIYSLSNCAPLENGDDYTRLANCYRTTGDIRDEWQTGGEKGAFLGIKDICKYHRDWQKYCGPGYFPDADMMVVGNVFGWDNDPHPTKLTADEQYTHVSMWTLWASPMLLGCPVESLDAFTKSLLTNVEVLDVHQDSLAVMGKIVSEDEKGRTVIVKPLEDGSVAVGLFNMGDDIAEVKAEWKNMGLSGKKVVRDLWRQKNVGSFEGSFSVEVLPHGCSLVKVSD